VLQRTSPNRLQQLADKAQSTSFHSPGLGRTVSTLLTSLRYFKAEPEIVQYFFSKFTNHARLPKRHDYQTQGMSKEELVNNLKDLLADLESGEVPFIRKVEELVVAE
jgi:hypothetical protein